MCDAMPALDHDLALKLDPADHSAMLAARIAERDAAIVAKDAARKQARATAKDGAAAKSATDAATAKTAALTTASAHEATVTATVAAVKSKHAATDLIAADEGHDIASGTYVMKAGPSSPGSRPSSTAPCRSTTSRPTSTWRPTAPRCGPASRAWTSRGR